MAMAAVGVGAGEEFDPADFSGGEETNSKCEDAAVGKLARRRVDSPLLAFMRSIAVDVIFANAKVGEFVRSPNLRVRECLSVAISSCKGRR